MSELDGFRESTRAWLEENGPLSLRGAPDGFAHGVWGGRKWVFADPDRKLWLERMAERGFTAPTWPAAYGGGGLSKAEAKVLKQELRRLQLPPALIGFGLDMIGPTLLQYGTEAQKQEHLPAIIRGQIRWCQGYSEPGSGSDLASLQTKAERDGEHFIINGQKIWTSHADESDWIFCLVRTSSDGPRQRGITFILFDMNQPGITTRPISLISGASPFCEVFFDNARARCDNVVHEVGQGWTVAKALLQHERTMIGDVFGAQLGLGSERKMVDMAKHYLGEDAEGQLDDPVRRDQLAGWMMDSKVFALAMMRAGAFLKAGQVAGAATSFFKVYGTELNQQRTAIAQEIAGPQGVGWEGEGFSPEEIDMARQWLRARGNSIEGGTNEIQLNIIAKRVLGLPG